MGNDTRKQFLTKITQNDRIKTIQYPQKSFKNLQEYLFLKRITLAYHLYLSCIIMTNTLKIWICLSASWNLRNCFIFYWYCYCSWDLDHLSVFLYSVQYFKFLNAWQSTWIVIWTSFAQLDHIHSFFKFKQCKVFMLSILYSLVSNLITE